jgi:hypothetical protein
MAIEWAKQTIIEGIPNSPGTGPAQDTWSGPQPSELIVGSQIDQTTTIIVNGLFANTVALQRTVDATSPSITVGDGVMSKENNAVLANTAGLKLSEFINGIAITAGGPGSTITIVTQGPLDPAVFNLGPGPKCHVGLNAAGHAVRVNDPTCLSGLSMLGDCDSNGAIYVQPHQHSELDASDFGLIGDDLTLNDTLNANLIIFMTNNNIPSVSYPAGIYRFANTIGPWPLGAIVEGSGLSKTSIGESAGTIFKFMGSGVGIELGHSADANLRNGTVFRNIEVIGGNPSGNASVATYTGPVVATTNPRQWVRPAGSWLTDGFKEGDIVYTTGFALGSANYYRHTIATLTPLVMTLEEPTDDEAVNATLTAPHYNEVAIEVLNDGEVVIDNCRTGGFKYQISLDGAEVAAVTHCSFDANAPTGYPSAEMVADLGVNSAFAIRMGTWASQAGLAANMIAIEDCQFNNTAWGLLHAGGFSQAIRDCNFETTAGLAIFATFANFNVSYANCLAEGGHTANFLMQVTCYDVRFDHLAVNQTVPFISLTQPLYGLTLISNNWTGATVTPIAGGQFAIGCFCAGNIGPWGAGSTVEGVIFDVDPHALVHTMPDRSTGQQYIGNGCNPTAPLDINSVSAATSKIRIRSAINPPPANSADPLGNVGDIAWDNNSIYVKTSMGWKKATLSAF